MGTERGTARGWRGEDRSERTAGRRQDLERSETDGPESYAVGRFCYGPTSPSGLKEINQNKIVSVKPIKTISTRV